MKGASAMGFAGICLLLAGCEEKDPRAVTGYVEGDFVHVAAPSGGRLEVLSVEKGDVVKVGADLFTLDATPEQAAVEEAESRVAQAQADLEDARRGSRESELAAIQAQLGEAEAALSMSEVEAARQARLLAQHAVSEQEALKAKTLLEQDKSRVERIREEMKTAQLGAREKRVVAAEREVDARVAALKNVQWQLAEKHQVSPVDGEVTEVMYREGDWVGATSPVVMILPPKNIKVRAFVSEKIVGTIHTGDRAMVSVDGVEGAITGKVTFVSPRAEYTPPVIYSSGMREKFVFMVEIGFKDGDAEKLHPGQPVDVHFPEGEE